MGYGLLRQSLSTGGRHISFADGIGRRRGVRQGGGQGVSEVSTLIAMLAAVVIHDVPQARGGGAAVASVEYWIVRG